MNKDKRVKEKNSTQKKDIIKFYEWGGSEKPYVSAYGIHFGFYEKGIRTNKEAVINMNDFAGKQLELDAFDNKSVVLDVGCGVGGTSIHLAKKYPHIKFLGISIVPRQIYFAKKFAEKEFVSKNTEFIFGDYLKTGMSDNFFNGIIAIESVCYAEDKKKFLVESYRILKPNKKIVIIDGFLTKKPSNYFIQTAYNFYCKKWVIPYHEDIDNFKSYLLEIGFENIKIQDISKNIVREFIYSTIYGISRFFRKKENSTDDQFSTSKKTFNNLIVMIFSPILIGLDRTLRYIAITAVKKE